MDQKQFELFQSAVQWVVDEQRRKRRHQRKTGPSHIQGHWGVGKITGFLKGRVGQHERDYAVVCASSCCLAGDIVLLNGDRFVTNSTWHKPGDVETAEQCMDAEGLVHSISDRATMLAGLTPQQAMMLFAAENSADAIIQQAQVIAAKNGYELEVI